jgi:hypothetical protein
LAGGQNVHKPVGTGSTYQIGEKGLGKPLRKSHSICIEPKIVFKQTPKTSDCENSSKKGIVHYVANGIVLLNSFVIELFESYAIASSVFWTGKWKHESAVKVKKMGFIGEKPSPRPVSLFMWSRGS